VERDGGVLMRWQQKPATACPKRVSVRRRPQTGGDELHCCWCCLTFELTPTAEAGVVSPVRDDATAGTDRAYNACRSGSGAERGVRPQRDSACEPHPGPVLFQQKLRYFGCMTLQGLLLMGVLVATAYASGLALSSLVQRQWRSELRRFWLYIGAALVTNVLLYLFV
jgi:hypothetical protein